MSKVIRIDEEVYAELQWRARPFEDTPNTVLRRLLGLEVAAQTVISEGSELTNSAIERLLDCVEKRVGQRPRVRPTRSGKLAFLSKSGTVVASLSPQQRRLLKARTRRDWAEKIRATDWDHLLPGGWFSTEDGVYWYAPHGDEAALERICSILAKLWMLDS